jgi:hypothetical protein
MTKKIRYGKKDLIGEHDLEDKNVKVRITMWVSMDVLKGYKKLAAERGTKYQTLMNETLRNSLAHLQPAEFDSDLIPQFLTPSAGKNMEAFQKILESLRESFHNVEVRVEQLEKKKVG